MRGETILTAYTKAAVRYYDTNNANSVMLDVWARQTGVFRDELERRLRVGDAGLRVIGRELRTPEETITAIFGSVMDMDGFFSALVAELGSRQIQIESQNAEIADLKDKLKSAWQTDAP